MESDKRPPTLRECIDACLGNQDFMREYRRLHGHALGLDTRNALDQMIDAATGYRSPAVSETEARQFFEFVRDYVWAPVLAKYIAQGPCPICGQIDNNTCPASGNKRQHPRTPKASRVP